MATTVPGVAVSVSTVRFATSITAMLKEFCATNARVAAAFIATFSGMALRASEPISSLVLGLTKRTREVSPGIMVGTTIGPVPVREAATSTGASLKMIVAELVAVGRSTIEMSFGRAR